MQQTERTVTDRVSRQYRKLTYRKGYALWHELSFSKPSVSVAMKNLKANNYITIDENGFINLTETGMEIADKIYERHTFLTGWLTSIGVDPEVASEDACKVEHAISAESFSAIKKYIAEHEK